MSTFSGCKSLIILLLSISVSIGITSYRSGSDAFAQEGETAGEVEGEVVGLLPDESALMAVEALDGITTESGLKFILVKEGSGPKPLSGQLVKVAYTGQLADGSIFKSTSSAAPYIFTMGQEQVIPGWEEGFAMLNEGGKAKLLVPPALAYGDIGAEDVGPDATLIFDIELLSIFEGAPASPTAVDEAEFTVTDSGLKFYDVEIGDGGSPGDDYMVTVHYTGWLIDGEKFASSLDWDTPYRFSLDHEQVIPGWEEGIRTMQVGGKRQLVVPPALAYGDEGIDNVVPGRATLIFDVELLEILRGSPDSPAEVDVAAVAETESGLKFNDIEIGDGVFPGEGSIVTVHYTGWLADGTKFESSLDYGAPYMFQLGQEHVILGWEEGIRSMQVGGHRQLMIPPALAYGVEGVDDLIPPDETLLFEVELVAVQ